MNTKKRTTTPKPNKTKTTKTVHGRAAPTDRFEAELAWMKKHHALMMFPTGNMLRVEASMEESLKDLSEGPRVFLKAIVLAFVSASTVGRDDDEKVVEEGEAKGLTAGELRALKDRVMMRASNEITKAVVALAEEESKKGPTKPEATK